MKSLETGLVDTPPPTSPAMRVTSEDEDRAQGEMDAFMARIANPAARTVVQTDFTVTHRMPNDPVAGAPGEVGIQTDYEFFDGPFGAGGFDIGMGDLVTLRGQTGDVTARIVLRKWPYWLGEVATSFGGVEVEPLKYTPGQKIWFGDLHVIGVVKVAKPGSRRRLP